MSNTRKPSQPTYSVAKYRALASGKPFVLEREDGSLMEIPRPDTETMFELEDMQRLGTASSRTLLERMCGEVGDEVVEMVKGWPIEATNQFVSDLQESFGMGESAASSG